MLSNQELFQLCDFYKLKCNGITLKNDVPKKRQSGFRIYNLDKEGGGGTHWTCSFTNVKRCVYFDSFGAPPPNVLDNLFRKQYKLYGMNNWIVQNYESEMCGFYCLAFGIFMNLPFKGGDFFKKANAFVNLFADDSVDNEKRLQHFFIQIADRFGVHQIVKKKLYIS